MISLGTIGTSNICELFLSGAFLTGRFKLSAVYSRSYSTGFEFGKKFDCNNIYTNLREMATNKDLEAVYIASPNALHYSQSKFMLENGKHVICEKPITSSAREYRELKALADKKGLIYIEAIMSCNTDSAQQLKAAIKEIGKISLSRIDFCQRSSRLDSFLAGEKVNIFDMSLKAGALADIGVYCVYAAVDLFGMPKTISASHKSLYNGADGSGTIIFEYDDFSAVLTYSKTGQSFLGSEIIGYDGTIKISSISQYAGIELIKDGKTQCINRIRSKPVVMSFEANQFADYIENFSLSKEKYEYMSKLCENVHMCMDEIKTKAGIIYPEN